ncbi:MAG: tetratricopeptide repeat protein, partial [Candidatus Margulisiibacteriota bacterium]
MAIMKATQEQLIRERLQQDPGNAWLIKELGDIYLDRNDYQAAQDQYQMVLHNSSGEMFPEILIKYENKLKEDYSNIPLLFNLSRFLLSGNEIHEAIDELELILELEPGNREAYIRLSKIYMNIDNKEMVVATLERASACLGEDLTVMEMLAIAYLQQNMLSNATVLYQEIYRKQPENIKTIKTLAELYKKNGWPQQAAEQYLVSSNYDNHCLDSADQFVRGLIEEYPDNLCLYEIHGEILLRWFKPEEAIDLYKYILSRFPDTLEFVIKKYKKVLDLYPDYPAANNALAEANILRQSFSEAVLLYSRILELNPDSI